MPAVNFFAAGIAHQQLCGREPVELRRPASYMMAVPQIFGFDFRRPLMVLKSALAAALCTGLLMFGQPCAGGRISCGRVPRHGSLQGPSLAEAARPGNRIRSGSDRSQNRSQAGENRTRDCAKGRGSRRCAGDQGSARRAWCRAGWRSRAVLPAPSWRDGTSNPLDAQARDTRIQTWPCRSGAICGWQNQPSPD